jgi:hypothetical protein
VKPIRLSDHAMRYMGKRGFTIAEVEDAIRTMPWQLAELGRLDCKKDFAYGKEWNGKSYATKQIRPVADYDSEGRLAGLEILDARKRFGGTDTMRRVELEGIGT